ncbi:hypothetical protein Y1Q_0013232 [Alligator mississippiensis]|uniref:Uncharacterized protein n=1 Tax=Alligator mississippiensis TaxID=8496 RepID=A0A151NU50_ALLMI|nr:hypothetical protein Y1Q_0013232 [Alligator mississippiensis]
MPELTAGTHYGGLKESGGEPVPKASITIAAVLDIFIERNPPVYISGSINGRRTSGDWDFELSIRNVVKISHCSAASQESKGNAVNSL